MKSKSPLQPKPEHEITLREHLTVIGKLGGGARTEAQRLARQKNAAKMREAKAKKRKGLMNKLTEASRDAV